MPARAPASPTWAGPRAWTRWVAAGCLGTDAAAAVLSTLVGYLMLSSGVPHAERYLLGVLLGPPAWIALVGLSRGYESRWFGSGPEEFRCVLRAGLLMGGGAATSSYYLHADLSRGYLFVVCVLGVGGSLGGRLLCRLALHAGRRRGHALLDVVIVGHEGAVVDLVRQVVREVRGGLHLVGACVPGGESAAVEALGVPVLGDLHDTSRVVRDRNVHTVVVTACAEMGGPVLRRLAWDLEGSGVDLVVSPGLVEVAGPRLHVRPLCGLQLVHVEEPELVGGRRLVKAAIDRAGALVALLLLTPLLLGTAFAVRMTSPGPMLFTQVRVGKDGREFTLRKFRTMRADAEQLLVEVRASNVHGAGVLFKVRQDPRVTPLGRWLRRYSVDELPQLVNVVRGDMSLVGPRPPLPSEVARYGDGVHRRLLVKPGLTGLWQIRGRSDLSWDESIQLDLRYVENWSLALDVMILWKTVTAVLGGRGAY